MSTKKKLTKFFNLEKCDELTWNYKRFGLIIQIPMFIADVLK